MGGRVLVALLDVLPVPVVADDLLAASARGRGRRPGRRAPARRSPAVVCGTQTTTRRRVAEVAERLAHLARDLDEPASCARCAVRSPATWRAILRDRWRRPPGKRRRRRYRDEADRFLAALDEEYYLHFAGHKDELDARADLRAPRRPHDARRLPRARGGRRGRRGARVELWRFACEGYLGNLTREDTETLAELEATLEVEVDGETIGFRLLRAGDRERARPRAAAAARARPRRAGRGAAEPDLRAALAAIGSGRRRARRAELPRAVRALRLPPGRARRGSARSCSARPRISTSRSFDKLFRDRLGHPARGGDAPRPAPPARATDWDAGFPAASMLPALTGTLADLGIDLAAQRERRARRRAAAAQEPARVLRADRGARPRRAGDPADGRPGRLARALPRGRAHRALRAHLARTSRSRRAGSATTRSPRAGRRSSSASWTIPLWLERRLDFGRPDEFAAENGRHPPLRPAPLRREGALRAGAACERRTRPGWPIATSSCSATRRRSRRRPPTTSPTWTPGFYASVLRPLVGVRGADRSSSCASEFGNAWFSRREAGSLLRELWERGPAPHRRRADPRRDRIRPRFGVHRRTIKGASAGMRRVVIAGAAGRDFHNFNVAFRGRDDVRRRRLHRHADPRHRRPRLPARAGGPGLSGRDSDRRRGGARGRDRPRARPTRSCSPTRTSRTST